MEPTVRQVEQMPGSKIGTGTSTFELKPLDINQHCIIN
jgi:hypothetical protein